MARWRVNGQGVATMAGSAHLRLLSPSGAPLPNSRAATVMCAVAPDSAAVLERWVLAGPSLAMR